MSGFLANDVGSVRLTQADFFDRDAVTVAEQLVGALLLVEEVGGVIVETEAYRRDDEASHSYNGPTARNAPMFGKAAHVYVYRSYGLHWCMNVVCEPGSAVLIRALQPTHGLHEMRARRGQSNILKLCAGPGNVCQALSVNLKMNGAPILAPPFVLGLPQERPPVASGPRIGISKAADRLWRFAIAGSPYLSKPMRSMPRKGAD